MNQLIHEILLVAESEIRFYLKIPQLTHRSSNVIKTSLVIHHYEATLHRWHAYNTKVLPVKTIYLRQQLQLMLSNCTIEFNNEYYNQLYGTPMGAPVSVRIANIFMYKLLNKFLDNYKGPKPLFTGRLIDDLFYVGLQTGYG